MAAEMGAIGWQIPGDKGLRELVLFLLTKLAARIGQIWQKCD